MAMKVVDIKTEKVFENSPNAYLRRAEEKLKIGRYDEALEEARLAVNYSSNNNRVIDQYNKIKDALNSRGLDNNSISEKNMPVKTYYASEVMRFSDADFLILDKYIINSGKIAFDILVKRGCISTGSAILIHTNKSAYSTNVVSVDAPGGGYIVLKDGSIQIVGKGAPHIRNLYGYATTNDIVSIFVQGVADDYIFITPMELAKGLYNLVNLKS